MTCPVTESDTDFQAGFRVDLLRAHPWYRKAAWHDNVSTRALDRGSPTYAQVAT